METGERGAGNNKGPDMNELQSIFTSPLAKPFLIIAGVATTGTLIYINREAITEAILEDRSIGELLQSILDSVPGL